MKISYRDDDFSAIFDFSSEQGVIISSYMACGSFTDVYAKKITLMGSNDGIKYTTIHEKKSDTNDILNKEYDVDNKIPFLYYKAKICEWNVKNFDKKNLKTPIFRLNRTKLAVRALGEKFLHRKAYGI